MADNPLMTIAEIETQFPSEWVLIDDPETDDARGILGGKVVFHSKNRAEVFARANALPSPRTIAVWYTGPFPMYILGCSPIKSSCGGAHA